MSLTSFGRSCHDDGKVEEFAQLGMSVNIVSKFGSRVVFDQLEEAELMIYDEEDLLL